MLIGLCGFARSGKDTVGNIIADKLNLHRVAFADALKSEVCRAFGITLKELAANKELWRPMLVEWGRARRRVEPDYWINEVAAAIDSAKAAGDVAGFYLPDCRYINEIEWIQEQGGKVFYLHRNGYGPANDEERDTVIPAARGLIAVQNVEKQPSKAANAILKLLKK
jgi:hypothetical protein